MENASGAIEFYTTVFGAQERMRMPAQNGKLGHSELEFGDSLIMLADVFPEMGGQTPQSLGGHRRAADPGGGGAGARFAGPGARRPEPTA